MFQTYLIKKNANKLLKYTKYSKLLFSYFCSRFSVDLCTKRIFDIGFTIYRGLYLKAGGSAGNYTGYDPNTSWIQIHAINFRDPRACLVSSVIVVTTRSTDQLCLIA